MSAVRIAGGTLTMEAGSVICDNDTISDRDRGDGGHGPAGAVWLQGGTVTMEPGSVIEDVVGRAIYADSGTVEMDGAIQNIKQDKELWMNGTGTAVHLRNQAEMTMRGLVTEIQGGNYAIEVDNATLKMREGSVLSACQNGINLSSGSVEMNGEITGITGGHAINMQSSGEKYCKIGKTGYIHDNKVNYGAIYIQAPDGVLDIYGRINNNESNDRAGAVALANNFSGHRVTMYDGAEIIGNTASDSAGGILISCGTFTMKGGTISSNNTKTNGGALHVRRGGQFVMEGGVISDNTADGLGGGIFFEASDYNGMTPYADMQDGTISGNADKNGRNDLAVGSTDYGKTDRYLRISDTVVLEKPAVYFETEQKTVLSSAYGVKLGNARKDSIDALNSASEAKGWGSAIATLWVQCGQTSVLEIGGLQTINSQLPVYVASVVTNADGSPAGYAEVRFAATTVENGVVSFTLPADTDCGCAVALVQPTMDFGTLTLTGPARITESAAAQSYEVTYTAQYTMSESLKNMIDEGASVSDYTITLDPDRRLTAEELSRTGDHLADGEIVTFTTTLSAAQLADGQYLNTAAGIQMTVSGVGQVFIPSNTVSTAMMALQRCTITFHANGGTFDDGSSVYTQNAVVGDTVMIPADPIREGFEFTGWKPAVRPVAQGNAAYYAQWKKPDVPVIPEIPEIPVISTPPVLNTEDHVAYIIGDDNGLVRPEDAITRAEVATIFFRLLTDESRAQYWCQSNTFTDVPAEEWYNNAVSTMAKAGVLTGDPDGCFRPNAAITRAEFAAVAARFSDAAYGGAAGFVDVSADHWAAGSIALAEHLGWITGDPDGRFRPDEAITRAEAMTLINRVLERATEREQMLPDMLAWADNNVYAWYYEAVQEATNSHAYVRLDKQVPGQQFCYEEWHSILENPDWTALERSWSVANGQ